MKKYQEQIEEYWIKLKKNVLEKYLDLYMFYVKGIEDGPRIEKRMYKFQKKFERMMKRRGIALVAQKTPDGGLTMSFVSEKLWQAQIEKMKDETLKNIDEVMKEKGDEIKSPYVNTEQQN